MNKSDLVDAIKDDFSSRAEADRALDSVIAGIRSALTSGDGEVKIAGFGSLQRRTRRARKARNPQSGEIITIDAWKTVVFRPYTALKEAL